MVTAIKTSYSSSTDKLVIFFLAIIFIPAPCTCSIQRFKISPGFQGAQMNFIDNNGLFLLSNDSTFAFGFINTNLQDTTDYVLAIVHQGSTISVVWTANGANPVSHSDNFMFGIDGNAYLQSGTRSIWSTNTSNKGVLYMELLNSGNLVLLSSQNSTSDPVWQSFSYPTDTILSSQNFAQGMKLVSKPNNNDNLSFTLEFRSGDLILFAEFKTQQPYWSMKQDNRNIINKDGGNINSASINGSAWNLYDQKHNLLSQFIVEPNKANDPNIIWAIVLGSDGLLHFYGLQNGASIITSSINIPENSCDAPEACGPYFVCNQGGKCLCPEILGLTTGCNPGISSCDSNARYKLANIGDRIGYFATRYAAPFAKSNLTNCKFACMTNCSCVAMFFDEKSSNCFLFDQIGSLQQLDGNTNFTSFIKILSNDRNQNSSSGNKQLTLALVICFCALIVICGLVYMAIRLKQRRKRLPEPLQPQADSDSEEGSFLDNISGVPVRFTYKELQEATDDFSIILGQGGFGSVYLGKLKNGYEIAVKKLEGIGQGKKEFRAEVTTIGSIHHIHLVKLRGFCAEGTHRLLAYEYMSNGSLERWIFNKSHEDKLKLDWDTRYNIALGTAKGLAYLHEDCDVKIVHCDIKPENVLLDQNFTAKVSDFGLAKLMTREQSHVFTTMRGTRGYLAPEWITSYAISERSDVYSFGMVLLEIIGGRKNFDPRETSEKAHFPSYAFKKMDEGKLKEVFDNMLVYDEKDERIEICIKVALWCIQEDLSIRPSMAKVVQMLEGVSYVERPLNTPQLGFRMYANLFKAISEDGGGSSSGPSDCNSDALLSAVRLSGPR